MTNRDRDSVAKLLLLVADRLAGAPEEVVARSKQFADERPEMGRSAQDAYQAGALESACKAAAEEIRRHVAEYLSPRESARIRGRR